MLHIPNDHAGIKPLPDGLRARLEAKPEPLSPSASNQRDAKHDQLRAVHIDTVKERAARDLKRAEDAASRKLQLQDSLQARTAEKLTSAEDKASARKDALAEKLAIHSARREALAASVQANRHDADVEVLRKGLESATRGQQAVETRQKLLDTRVWRSGREVKHALDVAQSHKENLKLAAQAKGEMLADKLDAAESRRQESLKSSVQFAANYQGRARNFAVARQEQAFAAQLKKAKLTAALERASEKREHTTKVIQEAAAFFNEHAADVARQVKGTAPGPEHTTSSGKAKIFERLMAAKVTRSLGLRAKVEQSAAAASVLSARPALSRTQGFHPVVIQVEASQTEDEDKPAAAPPAALLRRLSVCPRTLLATAAARQLGASARREVLGTRQHSKHVLRIGRVAKAAAARAGARAELISKLEARNFRFETTSAYKRAVAKRKRARANATARLVEANRTAIEEAQALAGLAAASRGEEACEKRAKVLRTTSKRGVVAVRTGAASGRRATIVQKAATKGLHCSLRCLSAEQKRSTLLEARASMAAQLAGSPRSVHWSGAISVE